MRPMWILLLALAASAHAICTAPHCETCSTKSTECLRVRDMVSLCPSSCPSSRNLLLTQILMVQCAPGYGVDRKTGACGKCKASRCKFCDSRPEVCQVVSRTTPACWSGGERSAANPLHSCHYDAADAGVTHGIREPVPRPGPTAAARAWPASLSSPLLSSPHATVRRRLRPGCLRGYLHQVRRLWLLPLQWKDRKEVQAVQRRVWHEPKDRPL